MSRRCVGCDHPFRPDGRWQRLCWDCWHDLQAQAKEPRTVVVSPVDAHLLLSAIALCHSDRHPPEHADLCHRVTAALTVALKSVREAA